MNDVLEVRPGALTPEDLDALVQGLKEAPARTGQAPRLVGSNGASIELPGTIRALLVSVVDILKRGEGVSIIPLHAELTTVQAAEVLNVSRPHLVKQLQAGALPHHMVGTTAACGSLTSSPTETTSTLRRTTPWTPCQLKPKKSGSTSSAASHRSRASSSFSPPTCRTASSSPTLGSTAGYWSWSSGSSTRSSATALS